MSKLSVWAKRHANVPEVDLKAELEDALNAVVSLAIKDDSKDKSKTKELISALEEIGKGGVTSDEVGAVVAILDPTLDDKVIDIAVRAAKSVYPNMPTETENKIRRHADEQLSKIGID